LKLCGQKIENGGKTEISQRFLTCPRENRNGNERNGKGHQKSTVGDKRD
jgi:hypothetical protein